MHTDYDSKIEQLLEVYHELKRNIDNELFNINASNSLFKQNAEYHFFISKQRFFTLEFEHQIDTFFFIDYAPIELIINKLNENTFRSIHPNLLFDVTKQSSYRLDKFRFSHLNEVEYFFAVRSVLLFYVCLKYHDITSTPPRFEEVCIIQRSLPDSCKVFLSDYIAYIANVYPNGIDKESNLSHILVVPDQYISFDIVSQIYDKIPWYKEYVSTEEMFKHILSMALTKSTSMELLKRYDLGCTIYQEALNIPPLWFTRFLVNALAKDDLDLVYGVFQNIPIDTRNCILSTFVSSRLDPTPFTIQILSLFRVAKLSTIEDVKINWVIYNMENTGYLGVLNDKQKWFFKTERVPINPSEPVLPTDCSTPMLIMPPLFGSSIIPDDVILSLNKSLKGQYHLISNVLLFILMPYNKSFHKDTEYVVRRYTRELLAIEHTNTIPFQFEDASKLKKRKNDEEKSNERYIVNGKRSKKMYFHSYKIQDGNPLCWYKVRNYLSRDTPHLPFFPWVVIESSNECGYLDAQYNDEDEDEEKT